MIPFIIPNFLKKYVIYAIIILGFAGTVYYLLNKIADAEKEQDRLDNVIKNINMEVAVSRAKNGELIYTVNSLTVKGGELEVINKNLANSLANLNLHYKNLQSVTNIQYKYITLLDTVHVASKVNKLKYRFNKVDKYSEVSGYINLTENLFSTDSLVANNPKNYPFVSDLNFENKDTLLIVPEFTYKRSWIFWKKITGVKVHIKSESPSFKLDRIESFQITK